MEFLKILEDLRTPFLDSFFSLITHLGEETVFIVLGLIFFWCINKREGYYLLSIGFLGTVVNQFLKIWFRIPRPWVKDTSFTIVESARAEATGYSFPSGHTQSSVGVFGGIARWNKNLVIRIICIIFCILVPFSRLYLGVHTPLDVGVSVIIALALIFGIYPLIRKASENKNITRIIFLCLVLLSLGLLLFVSFYKFPDDIDIVNLENCRNNAYKMLGCTLGVLIAFEADEKFIHFETEAVWWAQILKFVLGLIPVLAVKEGLRGVLALVFGTMAGNGVRYFILVIVAAVIWPLTFKWFSKLGKSKQ